MREFCCIQLLFNGKTNWMFLLVGLFKALWLMVTFLASLNSVDILIFQRRSIFRSLIFGPDFPEFCPHWMFHPFFKAQRAHQKMKGKAKYAWQAPTCLDQAEVDISPRYHQILHFFYQAFRRAGSGWHFSDVSSANIVRPTQTRPPPNLEISTGN